MKIDPSTISTNLDYGHNSDQDSEGSQQQRKRSDKEYSPILPHDDQESASAKRLAARKARKKKRKIAERKARQKDEQKEDEL